MYAHIAYFDDSGKRESKVLLVGGYIASVAGWERFNADWRSSIATKHIKEFAFDTADLKDAKALLDELNG
jgi:hypothetical protein